MGFRRRRHGRRRHSCARRRPTRSRAIRRSATATGSGLDNQGRDVVARVIYGFRISVLFGLMLTILSSAHRRRGRRGAGLLRWPRRSHLPALPRDLVVDPLALRADHHLVGAGAGLLDAARRSCCSSIGSTSSAWCAPNSCARATSSTSRRRARSACRTRTIMWKHVLPNAMVATLTFLPFQLSGSITALTALDFLGLGTAARIAVARRAAAAGQGHLEAPWLGLSGFFSIAVMLSLLIFIGEAVRDALDPRKTFVRGTVTVTSQTTHSSTSGTCRSPSAPERQEIDGGQGRVVPHRQGRDGGARRRVGLRQDGVGAVDPAAAALSRRLASFRARSFSRAATCSRLSEQADAGASAATASP